MVRASTKARVDQSLVGFISDVSYHLMLIIVCIASLSCLGADTTSLIDLVIGTSYHDDLRDVRQFLEEVVKSDARILADPALVVAVSELGDSSVNFVVRPWVLSSNYNLVKFHLIEQIKLGFDARGLTIPFPSRDVFVHHSMAQNTLPFVSDQSSFAA